MDSYSDNFNEHSDSLREKRERDDFDNLQHTLSGVETGQQTRHGLNKDTDGSVSGSGKRKSGADRLRETLEWLLLNDQQYRLAHESLMNSLQEAQQVTQSALGRVMGALVSERAVLAKMLSSAAKLPDGTKVFKDKNGNIRNQDGEIIADDRAASIIWRGGEPSYEAFVAQRGRIEELEAAENELRGIEAELGDIHARGNTDTKPLTPEELQRDTDRTDVLKDRVEKIQNDLTLQIPSDRKLSGEAEALDSSPRSTAVVPTVKIGT